MIKAIRQSMSAQDRTQHALNSIYYGAMITNTLGEKRIPVYSNVGPGFGIYVNLLTPAKYKIIQSCNNVYVDMLFGSRHDLKFTEFIMRLYNKVLNDAKTYNWHGKSYDLAKINSLVDCNIDLVKLTHNNIRVEFRGPQGQPIPAADVYKRSVATVQYMVHYIDIGPDERIRVCLTGVSMTLLDSPPASIRTVVSKRSVASLDKSKSLDENDAAQILVKLSTPTEPKAQPKAQPKKRTLSDLYDD